MARKLKVFKTPIGFHDAYVAAPSRKAALEAWGASTDLFSAGIAEQVSDDTEAAKAALAKSGEVVRIGRSGGKDRPSPRPTSRSGPFPKRSDRDVPARGRGRKPSRAALDKAETKLAELEKKQAGERATLAREEEKLAKRRQALEDKHRREVERAEAARDTAQERYRGAMAEWVAD